jgi:hypothetical protein
MFGMSSTKREGQTMLNMCMEQCEGVYLMDEIERLRKALERIADSSNWGEDGCWDADSYPNEIAEEALKEKE